MTLHLIRFKYCPINLNWHSGLYPQHKPQTKTSVLIDYTVAAELLKSKYSRHVTLILQAGNIIEQFDLK